MKKSVSLLLAGAMCAGLLAGCSSSSTSGGASAAASGSTAPSSVVSGEAGSKSIEKLSIAFVPSREPEEIITATEPLKEMLTAELAGLGYDVGEVEITVGTSYEAVGEALSAGTADVGLIPGGTYVLYDDGCDVLLTATRDGLSIDSDSAKDWNDNAPTEATTNQVTSYRALMIAGPSEKGQALAAKVNAGEDLTWEDVSGVNWSVMGSSSPAGYIYPSLWLQEQFDKNITELPHARRDYADKWTSEYAMTNSIWEDTAVIGVTPAIYNDTISVSKSSPIMDDDFKAALSQAFINIGDTEEGKAVISIYSHQGYQPAQASDYDSERAAQKMIQELNSAA